MAFFSLEMGKEQLVSRLLSSESLVEGTKLRAGDLSGGVDPAGGGRGHPFQGADLYFDDSPGITVPEMKRKGAQA